MKSQSKVAPRRKKERKIHNVVVYIITSLDCEMRICLIVPTYSSPTTTLQHTIVIIVVSFQLRYLAKLNNFIDLSAEKKSLGTKRERNFIACSLKCAFFYRILNFFICDASLRFIMMREITLISLRFAMMIFNRK